jgi:plasmid stabilization system protein ParE
VAARQIEDAAGWWSAHRPAAPDLVRHELERAFSLMRARPEIRVGSNDPRLVGVRRVYLSRVGYHLYYRHGADGGIDVVALWHARRGVLPIVSESPAIAYGRAS